MKENINSKNINIDFKKYKNDEIYLSIKDDGIGMTCSEFNGVMFSFIKNQNKELNYFQYGFSMKATALRLANNFLIISKTIKEISIGMISIELQKKINDKNCDYILTPIVNYRIEKKDNKHNNQKYIPKSNFPIESINLILEIIPFLFKSNDDLMKYFDSFETGTHIYLFDLKTIKKEENGYLKTIKEDNLLNKSIFSNYELLFDEEENDIYLNEDIGLNDEFKKNIIDFSLKKYLSFLYLKHNKHINIFIFGKKIEIENPYYNIKLMSHSGNNMEQITNLIYSKEDKNEKNIIDSFNIEGTDYNGILFNEKFIDSISSNSNIDIEEIKEKDYLNGILLYKDNILVSRLNQTFLGDTTFFIKKMMNINNIICNDENKNKYNECNYLIKRIFKRNGYLQLPIAGYELMFNNMEIKDQALFGFIYNKIKILIKKLQK